MEQIYNLIGADAVRIFNIIFGVISLVAIAGVIFLIGRGMQKRLKVPGWFFWTAVVFVLPVFAAPLLMYLSVFIGDNGNKYAPLGFMLINTYAGWLIGGFILSIRLYQKYSKVYSLLPSVLSWVVYAMIICFVKYIMS